MHEKSRKQGCINVFKRVHSRSPIFYYYCYIGKSVNNKNSVDPDRTPHSVASDLGLHCFQVTISGFPG